MAELGSGFETLQSAIQPPRKEVSLKTLKKKEKEKIMSAFKKSRDYSEKFYSGTIEPALIERKKIYDASVEFYKEKFPRVSELSNWISRDVKTTIDWMLPSILEVFIGTDDPCDIQGQNLNDDAAAKKLQSVIKYQINKKNAYFSFLYNFIKEGLITNLGVAKVYWHRDEDRTEMEVMVDETNLEQYLQMAQMGQIEIKKLEMVATNVNGVAMPIAGIMVYDDIKVNFNAPVLENMSPAELRFTPDGRTLAERKFVAQRKIVKGDYLKRKEREGVFQDVDKAIKDADDCKRTYFDQYTNDYLDTYGGLKGLSDDDNASKDVELYEAYLNVDYNNDGIMEHVIVHAVGDMPIAIQENTFQSIPFFVFSPEIDPYVPFGSTSYAKTLEQLQDLKTALIRQAIIAVAKNNNPQKIVDERNVNLDALLDGEEIVPVRNGNPADSIMVIPHTPIDGNTMSLVQYAQNEIESQSGSTRYNQGLDSNSLNKMLALDTPIPLADGSYKQNKDIVAGDMVIGSDGKPVKVLVAHPIQMPKRAFEITFQNGDVIKAGGEHRWAVKVSDKNYHHKSPRWEKLPTERLFDLKNTGHHIMIPRVGKVDFEEKELILDPYILGLWLGDGNSHTNRFTTMDKEIVVAFEEWSSQFYRGHVEKCKQQNAGRATTYQLVNTPFRLMLKDLHCLKDSKDPMCQGNVKHIPDIYLKGSFEQRLAILQGLMDTDGCIDKNGNAIFCNSEPALIESFVKLIESFGGKPNVCWNIHPANKFPNARPHAHVTFAIPYCPVRLPYKAKRWKTREKYWEAQRIVSIKEIPLEPMRCLTVNAEDELYCCGNRMTLTSNTASGINAIMGAADKKMRLLARIFAECAYVPILKHMIKLNQRFLDPYQQFRLNDEAIQISPDELDIDYDLIVNTGQGAATREAQMNYLIMIMQQLFPTLQELGVVNEKSWYETTTDLFEKMGIRNVQNYLIDPDSDTWKQAQAQKQQQAEAIEQKQLDTQLKIQQTKLDSELQRQSIPRMTLNYRDLPVEAKDKAILDYLGIQVPESDIRQKEMLDANLGRFRNGQGH